MPMVTHLLAMLTHRREKHSKKWCKWIIRFTCAGIALACVIWVHLQMAGTSLPTQVPGSGKGAGGASAMATNPMKPDSPSLCNPFDPNCFADGVAGWLAGKLQDAFKPISDAITGSSANIITQTPKEASYDNSTIKTFNQTFVTAFDGALAGLLAIGAVNIMIGHHWRSIRMDLGELIPRAILVTAAVHFNLQFLTLFIQLENALAQTVIDTAGKEMLTHIIVSLFTTVGLTNILIWILIIVLAVMEVYLLFQMIGRIALVAIGLSIAPLGLGCFLLPQTVRWGRLWLTTFTSAVIVQFLQVLALGLGGTFLTSIADPTNATQALPSLFLAIGTLGLVLKIPGMLQNWALHPAMGGSGGGNSESESSQGMGNGGNGGGFGSDDEEEFGFWGSGGGYSSGSSGSGGGDMGAGMSGSGMMEGTIVTEESGALLLLF